MTIAGYVTTLKISQVKEKILSVLEKGDILFIIPPSVTTKIPILGPHILQSIANRQGYKAEILHLNLLLASIIGVERYESVSYAQPFRMLGERLFARSAYGLPPLGNSPELCLDPALSVFGDNRNQLLEEFEYKYISSSDFQLEEFFEVEEICTSFIREATRAIADLNYKMVGCSSNWEQNNCSIALLNGLKHICPDTITLIGGFNCEGEMAEGIGALSDSLDYIFSGESETSFAAFLEDYSAGKLPSRRIIVGKPLDDLDTIPLPAYDGYIAQRKCFYGEDTATDWAIGHETSRGCWWGKCNFCGLNGVGRGRFRHKTAEKALADLEEINSHYPTIGIAMADKVMPISYQKELLPKLGKKKNSSPILYQQRVNLSPQNLVYLKDAGVGTIKPGIETLSTGLLELMNKGATARQNILLLRNAASIDIYVGWNLLWGFPGDKVEHYREVLEMLPLVRHLCPPAVFRHICIDRFSPYFEKAEEFKIDSLRPWASYKTVYPDWADVDKLACRFIGNYNCAAHEHPELIREIDREVEHWKDTWKSSSLALLPFNDYYIVVDNRGIGGQKKNHVLDTSQALEIMARGRYNESETQRWAVEEKLGALVDGWYVPLVTTTQELLLKFEKDNLPGEHSLNA
ncbi:MAG: RiPP maturation radical SAM protein 1 [bacterium]|nr:RiPP maturation radical SAM protein 1 [bacterium]